MASASDVPHKFDVVINSQGYRFADYEQRRAIYTYSPTFVPRTHVQGDYGDNAQDFWQTWTQRDWALGEQQKFYRADEDRDRRFWRSNAVDVRTVGQLTLYKSVRSLTLAAAGGACVGRKSSQKVVVCTSTNLYSVAADGTITDEGAHGLTGAPHRFGIATDGVDVYLANASSPIRKWTGSAFAGFGVNPGGPDVIEYLNNGLYGIDESASTLLRYDSAGAETVLHTWKQADGDARGGPVGRLRAFGGKLLVLWTSRTKSSELWLYDGVGVSIIAKFPPDFLAYDVDEVNGIALISGCFLSDNDTKMTPAVFYYANGVVDELWRATTTVSRTAASVAVDHHPSLAPYGAGMVWNDDTTGRFLFYNPTTGGVHSIGTYTVAGDTPLLAGSSYFFFHSRNQTGAYQYPSDTTVASGYVLSSQIDFDSSLTKRFKSVLIDADIPSGATVDLAYKLEGVGDDSSSYTSLQTGAASGTEYAVGQNGRAISVAVTLNKGSSSAGPTLKRVFARAAPILTTFKRREYILDLTGRDGKSHLRLRDGSVQVKDGLAMATDLITAATSTTPISITDRFGTFTGLIDPEGFQLIEVRPEEFVAIVRVREV